jgi:hypothetical protein
MADELSPTIQTALQAPASNPVPPPIAKALQSPVADTQKLDVSKYKVLPNDPSADKTKWGKRVGGTNKGMGFLGLLKNSNGGVSSELSIGVEIDGKEIEMPTLVPTLNQQEVDWLMANPNFQSHELPKTIHEKAVQHAMMRMQQGLSPFVD